MTFHQLRIFLETVETGSVTRASEKLGLPQPAATRAIRALEKEFGLSLFDRTGTGIMVNANGRILYDYARQVLRLTGQLESSMAARKEETDTTVSIGVEAASHLFPQICANFQALHEDAIFHALHRETPGYPLRLFSSRERPDDLRVTVLADEEIRLAVPKDGPFGERDWIDLKEVSRMGFVSLSKTRGLRQITDYYCQEAGFSPRIIFETDNTTTLTRYVNAGRGVAFIPVLTWPKNESDGQVHLLTIREPACRRFINLSVRDPGGLGRYERLFADFLKDYFQSLESRG